MKDERTAMLAMAHPDAFQAGYDAARESLEAKLEKAREDERDLRRALTAVVLAAGGHVIVRDEALYDLPKAVLTVTEVRAAPLDQCGYHYAVEQSQ